MNKNELESIVKEHTAGIFNAIEYHGDEINSDEEERPAFLTLYAMNPSELTMATAIMSANCFNKMLRAFLQTNPEYVESAEDAVKSAKLHTVLNYLKNNSNN